MNGGGVAAWALIRGRADGGVRRQEVDIWRPSLLLQTDDSGQRGCRKAFCVVVHRCCWALLVVAMGVVCV